MARYRSKPFEVEATQWNGPGDHSAVVGPVRLGERATVCGAQGWVPVNSGDWIIVEANPKDGHYPCSDEVFQRKYEPA
jgi:hypothetical protein